MAASRADKSKNKEQVLQEFVRYSIRAANGLGSIAKEEGRDLVKKMIEVKRITTDEGERLLSSLTERMTTSKSVFEHRIKETVEKTVGKLSTISSREIDSLNEKVRDIESRIEALVSKRNTNSNF